MKRADVHTVSMQGRMPLSRMSPKTEEGLRHTTDSILVASDMRHVRFAIFALSKYNIIIRATIAAPAM